MLLPHLYTAPHHDIALRVPRENLPGVGERDAEHVLGDRHLLCEETLGAEVVSGLDESFLVTPYLSPHEDVSLHTPYVEVSPATGHQDVVPLLKEPDLQHPVRVGLQHQE